MPMIPSSWQKPWTPGFPIVPGHPELGTLPARGDKPSGPVPGQVSYPGDAAAAAQAAQSNAAAPGIFGAGQLNLPNPTDAHKALLYALGGIIGTAALSFVADANSKAGSVIIAGMAVVWLIWLMYNAPTLVKWGNKFGIPGTTG